MRFATLLLAIAISSAPSAALAVPRSPALRAEFVRLNPCPANGATRGPCPGFEVDHVQPRCAGGAETIENLQWLPVEAHREKTRRDVAACRGRVYKIKAVPAAA